MCSCLVEVGDSIQPLILRYSCMSLSINTLGMGGTNSSALGFLWRETGVSLDPYLTRVSEEARMLLMKRKGQPECTADVVKQSLRL